MTYHSRQRQEHVVPAFNFFDAVKKPNNLVIRQLGYCGAGNPADTVNP